MTAPHGEQLVAGYLARLELALAEVAPGRRQEILEAIREHIAESRGAIDRESDADVLNVLDRLGEPGEVAAAAGAGEWTGVPKAPTPEPRRLATLDIAAVVLTPIFWPVGVIFLWMSSVFSLRDKLIGTFAPPGGYVGILFGFPLLLMLGHVGGGSCTVDPATQNVTCGGPPPGIPQLEAALWVVWIVLPVLTGIYLGVRLRRRSYSLQRATTI